ncbi:MAG: glycosyltransferase, partial [Candidatus Aminicenantes bacterium]
LGYRFISWMDSFGSGAHLSKRNNIIYRLSKIYHPYKKYWSGSFVDYPLRMRAAADEWKKYVKGNKDLKLVIMDEPLYFYPLVEYLYELEIPIVALCQNIESLSFSQLNCKHQLELFNKEIDLFKKCALVITISREETFLLKNFNIPAFYLPYYPVKSVEGRMLRVRERRKNTVKKGFLLLGTVGNKVTFDGMAAVIDFWDSRKNKIKNEKLLVAGYGTSSLLKVNGSEAIDFLGELSNEKLDDVLSRVRAMICFQEFGSGALTRIREMLTAGVPVLANSHAARSYHGFQGLCEFSGFDDLERIVLELMSGKLTIQQEDKNMTSSLVAAGLLARIRSLIK